jgi:hypothetical protein
MEHSHVEVVGITLTQDDVDDVAGEEVVDGGVVIGDDDTTGTRRGRRGA